MSFDLSDSIHRIQAIWQTVEGIRPESAPNEPRDNLNPLPFVLTYDFTGEMDNARMYSGTFAPQKGTIRSDLMFPRKNLAQATAQGRAMKDEFLIALKADPNLTGFLMLVTMIRHTFMPFDYGTETLVGYRIEMEYESEI